jgi:hypothetical protein
VKDSKIMRFEDLSMYRGIDKEGRKLRDFQRKKVYKAEEAAFFGPPDNTIAIGSILEAQGMVNKIVRTSEGKVRYPGVEHVAVRGGPSSSRRAYGFYFPEIRTGVITLPECWFFEHTLIHELAHVVTDCILPNEWHGPGFCRVYLDLMKKHCSSKYAHVDLLAAFVEKGVKYD